MEFVDPEQFVIKRRRKKYKFAKFLNAKNCFEFDEWLEVVGQKIGDKTIDLEIGAGSGTFLLQLARRHPKRLFVAVDVKADRLQQGAYLALAEELDNIFFVRARADQILQMFAASAVSDLWLNFSDPFPKQRSLGRRLTHQHFLKLYEKLLTPNGRLLIKHDDPTFFSWSLEQLVAAGWQIKQLSFDLHQSALDEDYKLKTTYEARWLGENRKTHFVAASKA